jgi:hypothetical protein
VTAFRGGRLLGASTALLVLAAGCGHSSNGSSTSTSAAGKSTPASSGPTQKPSAASTTPQPAPSTTVVDGTVTVSSGGVTATLHADTHHPKAGRSWPIRFTVERGNRLARASVSYEYLFAGQVVARRSHYTFTGRFSDIFVWPSSAVGYPLTFRAMIVAEGTTIDLDYPVQVTT